MHEIWDNVLAEIEQKISPTNFTTWFNDTFLISTDDGEITIGVKNTFFAKNLEKKFGNIITETFKHNNIEVKRLNLIVSEAKKSKVRPREVTPEQKPTAAPKEKLSSKSSLKNTLSRISKNSLNPNYTLDNFVITSSNDLAAGVAKSIINNPGKSYNPFYLYGGPGLGKTHLVQAIGNELLRNNPDYKILYSPINDFYTDFIESIRNGKGKEFSEKFKKLDCLIIDDIQFIVGKEKSQEEFFNIFNSLHQLGRQIIITSDRLPHQIKSIDERLSSRLSWAGTFDLQLPKFEDRCAILRAKTEFRGIDIENEAIEYIANNITTNIRDLEGLLNTVLATAEIRNCTPLEVINQGMINFSSAAAHYSTASPKQIVAKVAKYYNMPVETLKSKSRVANIKNARQVAMYLLKNNLDLSTNKIAAEVGISDHTTIMHGIKKITNDLKTDFELRSQIEEIRSNLYE